MIRFFIALIAGIALTYSASAQTGGDAVAPTSVREMADGLSGITVNDGQVADKIVYLGRAAKGDVVIKGIAAVAPGANDGIEPISGATAILRTRASTPNGNSAPDPADFALAARTGLPVFVIGEWQDPPILWEVRSDGRYRAIDAAGRPGEWQVAGP